MSALDRFTNALDSHGVSWNDGRDGLEIDCPAHHSGSGTSLHATYRNGRVLLHCFADCKTSDVLDAVGLDFHDLYDERLPMAPGGTDRAHEYRDAKNELIGIQTRQPTGDGKKRFTPLTRNPETGAWQSRATEQLKSTIYRLPEVLAAVAEGRTVWTTEGERDADSLWTLGIPATCNLNGAGKWTDAHARLLTGADVVVCQDNDEPGEKHRDAVFESLVDVARSVRMVRPAHGKDITDHLSAGFTVDQVEEVTPPERFTAQPAPSSWEPVDLAHVLSDDYTPPRAQIGMFGGTGGLFYAGEVNTVAGPSGTGKSWIAAAVVAENLRAGNRCLYVAHESTAGVIAHRLRLLGVSREEIVRHLVYVSPSDPHTVSPDTWKGLLAGTYTVAVLDGVTAAMALYGGGTNEQDAVARWFVDVPTPLARRTGAAVITVDHTSKTGETSGFAVGSQHKRAAVTGASFNLSAKVPMRPGQVGELHLTIGKDRHGDVSSRALLGDKEEQVAAVLRFDSSDPTHMTVSRDGVLITSMERTRDVDRSNILSVLRNNPDGLSGNAILEITGGKRERIFEVLHEMRDDDLLSSADGPRRSTVYSIPRSSGSLRVVPSSPIGGNWGEPLVGEGQTSVVPQVPCSDLGEPLREPLREPLISDIHDQLEGTTGNVVVSTVTTALLADGSVNPAYNITNAGEVGTEVVTYEEYKARMIKAGKWYDPVPGWVWVESHTAA